VSRYDEKHTMHATDPIHGSSLGEVTIYTHRKDDCIGDHCPIHRPSNHVLSDAPMNFRADKYGLIERLCEHGVGHPDPDSTKYMESEGFDGLGVHGCCGCC